MANAETARLVAELTLKDKMSASLKTADKNLRSFDKATANTQRSLGKFGKNIGKAFAAGAAATVAGGVIVVNAAADYESAFAGIRKTVEETANTSFEELSDAIRKMSKEIPIAASELAALGEAGGALGIHTDDLEEFIRVTALLGETTDLTAEDAANSLGIISNVLGLTSKEYSAFASSLVALGNAGASTESQIIAIAERSGAAGELIGLTTDQVLGLSSAVASLGIEEEAGGSALQKFFIDTAKFVNEGGDELKLFAKIAGTSSKQFKKNFEKDAGKALEGFLANLGQLSQGEQLSALEDLGFNDVRITRTLLGLANNTELVGSQMEVANKAFDENNALTKEAAERFKTFDSQLQITKNVLNDVAITIGSKLLPKITPLLQRFNEFVNTNQGQIEQFGEDLAVAFEDVADAISKVDWTPFIDGLKFTADVGKAALDIFRGMPDWLQKLIVAGFAVNKLTGGLVTSLGKDIFGAAGAQFFARGASPANPLWVASATGGVGGVPGAGGGSGVRGAIGSAVKTAAVIVPPLVVAAELQPHVTKAIAGDNVLTNPQNWLPPNDDPKPFWELMGQQNAEINTSIHEQTTLSQQQAFAIRDATAQGAEKNRQAAFNVRDAVNNKVGLLTSITQGVRDAAAATERAARAAGQQAAFAIRDKDLSVSVQNSLTVNTSVSVRETIKTQTTHKQFSKYIQ